MSDSLNNPSLETYLQRETTLQGRFINAVTDLSRELGGLPDLRQEALQYDAGLADQRAAQLDSTLGWEQVLAMSGLAPADRAGIQELMQTYQHDFPGIDPGQLDGILQDTIDYARQRTNDSQIANQLELFEPDYSLELTQQEKDFQTMSLEQWESLYADPVQDYAEAYADVAGDATLSWRLETENPIDILNDVRQQTARDTGLGR